MTDRFELTADGRLVPADPQSQVFEALAGNYVLAPTSPDLLILVRSPAQGGARPDTRMVLAGDLSGVPLAELMEFLHQGRRTGILRVITPAGERAIVLKDGMVRGAGSDDPADSIGEVCVQLGLVKRAKLTEVMADNPPLARVGRLLVERGVIKSHDLFRAVQHQVTEIFYSILLAREGAFLMTDQPVEERSAGVQLNTQGLLMDSIRRIDEMAQFRQHVPSGRIYVVRRKPAGDALEDEERQVFDLCDGTRSLLELAREVRLSEFEATRHVYHLLKAGYVSTSELAQPSPREIHRDDPSDVARVFNTIFAEILAAVEKNQASAEFLAAANGALKSESATRSPFFAGLSFDVHGWLEARVLLGNLSKAAPEMGANAARTLYDALSEMMFFLLFQAGELVSPEEDEVLAKRVKELLSTVGPL